MTRPTEVRELREAIIEAVGLDAAINMRTNKSEPLPFEIIDLSSGDPVVISSWANHDEAHEQLHYAIAARRADAALAAIEASGTYVEMREYEALARAARAYLVHPDLASAAGTLQGMVQRAERALAARPPA